MTPLSAAIPVEPEPSCIAALRLHRFHLPRRINQVLPFESSPHRSTCYVHIQLPPVLISHSHLRLTPAPCPTRHPEDPAITFTILNWILSLSLVISSFYLPSAHNHHVSPLNHHTSLLTPPRENDSSSKTSPTISCPRTAPQPPSRPR